MACLLTGLLLAACGKSEDGSQTKSAATTNVKLDACGLLAGADPAALLGEAVGEAERTTHDLLQKTKAAGVTIAHCSFSAKSSIYKGATLMLKHVANQENPVNGAAFVDSQTKLAQEFEIKAEEISGIGDVAVKVQMPGSFQLWVFWKKHYQLNAQIMGMEDEAKAFEAAKTIARHVLSKI